MKSLKLFTVIFCILISSGALFSQEEKSLAERLQLVEKQNDAFNFYLNMQSRGNITYMNGEFQKAYFENHQLRLEMRGSLNEYVSYRLRHRLNKSNAAQNLDGISKATDIASVSVRPVNNFTITLGKQCAAYGGYEFDLNPIDIYEYSDMIEYMDNFLAGIDFAYVVGDHEFRFQVLDARSSRFNTVYGEDVMNNNGDKIEESDVPFLYTLNWNGDLFDGMINTRWSYTYGVDAKDQNMNYVALGTQFNFTDNLQLQFDWMNSQEDIDRKGIMTALISGNDAIGMTGRAAEAEYNSFVAKLDIKANDDWNFFAKCTYETATAYGFKDEARVAMGYMGGVEYSPFDDNIKFFANYSRRDYSFEMDKYGMDYDTDRFSIGLVYRLKMF